VPFPLCAGAECPTAAAGADQILECASGVASVQLDGSASRPGGGGGSLTCRWVTSAGSLSDATAVRPTATLPLGSNASALTVSLGTKEAVDTVAPDVFDTTPLILTAPADVTVPSGQSPVLGEAMATDGCDTGGVLTLILDRPDEFPPGSSACASTRREGCLAMPWHRTGHRIAQRWSSACASRRAPADWPPSVRWLCLAERAASNGSPSRPRPMEPDGPCCAPFGVTDPFRMGTCVRDVACAYDGALGSYRCSSAVPPVDAGVSADRG
jgi:hypothetical protein